MRSSAFACGSLAAASWYSSFSVEKSLHATGRVVGSLARVFSSLLVSGGSPLATCAFAFALNWRDALREDGAWVVVRGRRVR